MQLVVTKMSNIRITFCRYNGDREKTSNVSLGSKLGENRKAVQMLLGLPENPPYKLMLERTGKELDDSLTFEEAGIQDNDRLILYSPGEQGIKILRDFTPPSKNYSSYQSPTSSPAKPFHIDAPTQSIPDTSKPSRLNDRLLVFALIMGAVIGIAVILAIVINSFNKNPDPPLSTSKKLPTLPENTSETNATVAGELGTKKNIRSGPGTDYRVVDEIDSGTKIVVFPKAKKDKGGYTWYEIYDPTSGDRGWMTEQLIVRDELF